MSKLNRPIVLGIGGLARSGKDTFVRVSQKVLEQNGYSSTKMAFADELKNDLDTFLIDKYGISAWTDKTEEKTIIRPFLVAHGCGKRIQTEGKYWVDKIDQQIKKLFESGKSADVIFISDCRFPNEVDWLHQNWSGWFVHLKKYSIRMDVDHSKLSPNESQFYSDYPNLITNSTLKKETKIYDKAPNEEEAKNDPLCEDKADYKLALENAIQREKRLYGNIITTESLVNNSYLLNEITLCLTKCPFLTIQKP
jgi:hypothetical protein